MGKTLAHLNEASAPARSQDLSNMLLVLFGQPHELVSTRVVCEVSLCTSERSASRVRIDVVSEQILVTGGRGRLGRALSAVGGAPHVRAVGREEVDITNVDEIEKILLLGRPAAVINAAGTSSVEAAEADPFTARAVNAEAPAKLAEFCARNDLPFIHISTDYVFGARADRPCRECDVVSPINTYGRTKAEGECRVLEAHPRACVVRVAWLFGDGEDFIAHLLSVDESKTVAVAEDQIGSPTPIFSAASRLRDLARLMIAKKAVPPILHLAGSPPSSRAAWVTYCFDAIKRAGGRVPQLRPALLSSFPSIAVRPLSSALDCSLAATLFGSPLDWRSAVDELGKDLITSSNIAHAIRSRYIRQ
jgi:dTDP-4-dehydrorhamnose reductase